MSAWPVASVREELAHTIRVLGWAGGITLLILIALVMRLHRNIVRPLRAMEGTMAGIAASLDFTQRVPVTRNDEIGQLIAAYNSMAHGLLEKDQVERVLSRSVASRCAAWMSRARPSMGSRRSDMRVVPA